MKSRTHGAETRWTLKGETITVFIPMTWKRRGGQKVIIAADGSDTWALAKLQPKEMLIPALARAQRWVRLSRGHSRPPSRSPKNRISPRLP
jgi:hypothetical protein